MGVPGKLEPTLVGFGIISSSAPAATPEPNLISVLPSVLIKVLNRLDVFTSFNKNGAKFLPLTKSGELFSVFWKSAYTVSCAKNGTSYQLFPSLSVTEIISKTGEFVSATLLYFSAAPNVIYSVVVFPLTAFYFFL